MNEIASNKDITVSNEIYQHMDSFDDFSSKKTKNNIFSETSLLEDDKVVEDSHPSLKITDNNVISIVDDFKFEHDINKTLLIEADDIIVDGDGYSLIGDSVIGIYLNGRRNVTIKNIRIKGWGDGIYLYNSTDNYILQNTIINNLYSIVIESSKDNNILSNNITSNINHGIFVISSTGCYISNNNISNTTRMCGILLLNSSFNDIFANTILNNNYSVRISDSSNNNIIHTNKIVSYEAKYSGVGINIHDSSNENQILNNTILNTFCGIDIYSSYYNTIRDNNIEHNALNGLILVYSKSTKILDNAISDNMFGIQIGSSSNNDISGNTVSNNSEHGITIMCYSNHNYISKNSFFNNNDTGVLIDQSSYNNFISDNFIFNNDDTGVFIDQFSNNNSISDNYIFNNDNSGILIGGSSNNNYILNNDLFNNTLNSITIHQSSHNKISDNDFSRGGHYIAILVYLSSDNVISGNRLISENTRTGISILGSSNNKILRNIISNTDDSGIGISITQSSNNIISNNNIYSNDYVGIVLGQSSNNIISNNNVSNSNDIGIRLWNSSSNMIYHNSFVDNNIQASDNQPADNFWHHPSLLEGNYWSDYQGVDDGSGIGKHAISGDGIGDTNIPWPSAEFDFYPLLYNSNSNITLDVQLTGEFDYKENEPIYVLIASLITNSKSGQPISNANVEITIFYPNGSIAINTKMVEKDNAPGVYLWESSNTLAILKPPKGIYLVYVTASYGKGPKTIAIMEFHHDPPGKATFLDTLELSIVGLFACSTASVLCYFILYRKKKNWYI